MNSEKRRVENQLRHLSQLKIVSQNLEPDPYKAAKQIKK